MLAFPFLTLVIAVSVVYAIWTWIRRPSGVPPGPPGWPFLGNLPQLGSDAPQTLTNMAQKYGNIFSLYWGPKLAVVINDYEMIKEALLQKSDIFGGRSDFHFMDLIMSDEGGVRGLIQTSGAHWKVQRRFALRTLKDFGMGKKAMEHRIHNEIKHFLNSLKDRNGEPFDGQDLFTFFASNIICSVTFGHRFDYSDTEYQSMVRNIMAIPKHLVEGSIVDVYPFLRHVPHCGKGLNQKMQELVDTVRDFIRRRIVEHQETLDDNNVRDFTDAYLKKIGSNTNGNTTFSINELVISLFCMVIAGTDTTSITIRWLLAYMMNYPLVQHRVQAEIDLAVGSGRLPSVDDQPNMPFTEATIMEVQRLAQVVPLAIPHATTKATVFHGYYIPAKTVIFPNLFAVHRNPKFFPEPEEFKPERFLNADGMLMEKFEPFLPFSIGSRICVGEKLAKMVLFLTFTAILQHFEVLPPEGENAPSLEGVTTISRVPRPFQQIFVARF